jgi:hypothetical protein
MDNKLIAQVLRSKGRNGDTDLVHVNEQEKMMLKAMGGSGTTNPHTGLTEYSFLSRLIDPIFGSRSAIHQKVIRPIGTALAAYFSGPFAPLTVAGINQLEAAGQGKTFEQGLKEAAIGGLLSYGGSLAGSAFGGSGGAAAGGANAASSTGGRLAGDLASQSASSGAVNAPINFSSQAALNASANAAPLASSEIGSSASNIAAGLGGNTAGTSLAEGATTAGALNVGGTLAAKVAAEEAGKQALYRKLLATGLKQGVGAIGDSLQAKPLPVYPTPDFLSGNNSNIQPQKSNLGNNPYQQYIYGYNPNAT